MRNDLIALAAELRAAESRQVILDIADRVEALAAITAQGETTIRVGPPVAGRPLVSEDDITAQGETALKVQCPSCGMRWTEGETAPASELAAIAYAKGQLDERERQGEPAPAPVDVLSEGQKMFVLLSEIRQCINDDHLVAAQRKVLAVEAMLKEEPRCTAVSPDGAPCMKRQGHEAHTAHNGEAWSPCLAAASPLPPVEGLEQEDAKALRTLAQVVGSGRYREIQVCEGEESIVDPFVPADKTRIARALNAIAALTRARAQGQ
jgi:hypothetical protein